MHRNRIKLFERNWETDIPPFHLIGNVLCVIAFIFTFAFMVTGISWIPFVITVAMTGLINFLYFNHEARMVVNKSQADCLTALRQLSKENKSKLGITTSDVVQMNMDDLLALKGTAVELREIEKRLAEEKARHNPLSTHILKKSTDVLQESRDHLKVVREVNKEMQENY